MISVFRDVKQTKSFTEVSVSDFLSDIRDGKWINEVISYRNGEIEKKKLPAVTLSGTFSKRAISGLIEHSGFICMDIDGQKPELVKEMLKSDVYCYAIWLQYRAMGAHVFSRLIQRNIQKVLRDCLSTFSRSMKL